MKPFVMKSLLRKIDGKYQHVPVKIEFDGVCPGCWGYGVGLHHDHDSDSLMSISPQRYQELCAEYPKYVFGSESALRAATSTKPTQLNFFTA